MGWGSMKISRNVQNASKLLAKIYYKKWVKIFIPKILFLLYLNQKCLDYTQMFCNRLLLNWVGVENLHAWLPLVWVSKFERCARLITNMLIDDQLLSESVKPKQSLCPHQLVSKLKYIQLTACHLDQFWELTMWHSVRDPDPISNLYAHN